MTATNDKWVLVPREATLEMLRAYEGARPESAIIKDDGSWEAPMLDWWRAKYAALLAAAPQPPGDEAVACSQRDRILAILHPYLDTGDSRTAADWAVAIALILSEHPAPDAALHARTEGEPDWTNRNTDSLAGWINELGTLGQHHDSMPGWTRSAIRTIYRGLTSTNTTPPAPLAPARITAKELQVALGLKQHASDPDLMIGKYDDNIVSKDALEAAASALSAKSGGVVEVTDAMVIAAWNACAPGKNNIDANDAIYMRTAIRAALTAALTPGAKGEGT